jgi:hypothetical protein
MSNDATIDTHQPCGETLARRDMLSDKDIAWFFDNRVQRAKAIVLGDSWHAKPNSALSSKRTRQVPPMWHSASSCSNDSAVRPSTKSARIALAHNIGGPTAVPAGTILEGPGANGS